MELNTIQNKSNWGKATESINTNFAHVGSEIDKLKYAAYNSKLYPSLEVLQQEKPNPSVGDWAIVGDTIPGAIYRCSTEGVWSATGETGGGYGMNVTEKNVTENNHYGDIINNPDDEDLTEETNENEEKVIKLADKEYNAAGFSGLGRVYLRRNISASKNVLTQDMMSKANTRYIIQYDYDLNGATINIPKGCVLDFQGGSFRNGVLNGNNTVIESSPISIFTSLTIHGTYINTQAYIEWFTNDISTDCSSYLLKALEYFKTVMLLDREYVISKINVPDYSKIHGKGKDSTFIVFNNIDDSIVISNNVSLDNFTIKIENREYIGEAISVNPIKKISASRVYGKDLNIKFKYFDDKIISDGVGIALKSTYGDVGIYFAFFENVSIERAGIALKIVASPIDSSGTCFVNTNTLLHCRAYACKTIVKTEVGTSSEIRGNVIDITLQNDVNVSEGTDLYDIPYDTFIQENYIKGYLWDLDPNLSRGSLLGNIGCNKREDSYTLFYSSGTNKYRLLGTLANTSEGRAFVKIKLNRYAFDETYISLYMSSQGIPVVSSIIVTDNMKFTNLYYKKVNNVFYIYITGLPSGFTYIDTNTNSGFTPISYLNELSALPSDAKAIYKPAVKYIAFKNANGEVSGIKYNINSYANSIRTSYISNEDVLSALFADSTENDKGIYFISATARSLGIDSDALCYCMVNKTGNGVSADYIDYGSTIIAYTSAGTIYTNIYGKNGWGSWQIIEKYSVVNKKKGTTAERPTLQSADSGFMYYDTDLKKYIVWNGESWTNLDGTVL